MMKFSDHGDNELWKTTPSLTPHFHSQRSKEKQISKLNILYIPEKSQIKKK